MRQFQEKNDFQSVLKWNQRRFWSIPFPPGCLKNTSWKIETETPQKPKKRTARPGDIEIDPAVFRIASSLSWCLSAVVCANTVGIWTWLQMLKCKNCTASSPISSRSWVSRRNLFKSQPSALCMWCFWKNLKTFKLRVWWSENSHFATPLVISESQGRGEYWTHSFQLAHWVNLPLGFWAMQVWCMIADVNFQVKWNI